MRTRYLLAAIVTGLAATAATAQSTGTTTGTTGTTGTTSGSSNTGLSANSTGTSDFQIQQQQAVPQITGGGTTGANVQSSNAFAGYYGNPQHQGRAGATGNDAPGGFGTALGGTGTTGGRAGSSSLGATTSRTGTSGTTGRTAASTSITGTGSTGLTSASGTGRTGTTGLGGTSSFGGTSGRIGTTGLGGNRGTGLGGTSGQSNATVIPLPRLITYTATMRMPMPAVNVPQMQTELRGVIDRSSMIANPKGIEVITNGSAVILRGRVKDEEEAQTAEGVIRLTPGVKDVQNELKY